MKITKYTLRSLIDGIHNNNFKNRVISLPGWSQELAVVIVFVLVLFSILRESQCVMLAGNLILCTTLSPKKRQCEVCYSYFLVLFNSLILNVKIGYGLTKEQIMKLESELISVTEYKYGDWSIY